jgi:hypothetical protein
MPFWVSQSKNRAYVVNVVSWYRRRLDRLLAARGWSRRSSGHSRVEFEPDLTKTFNRGYTTYFLHGRGEPPGALDSPKMVGEYLGILTRLEGSSFVLETAVPLNNGDGLCWFGPENQLQGTFVNGVRPADHGLRVTPADMAGLHPAMALYRNRDHAFLRQMEGSHPVREIEVQMNLEEAPQGLVLQAQDEDGVVAKATLRAEKVPAKKPTRAEATARRQLARTGGTPFACKRVELAWQQPYFLPVATLNALRRDVLGRLLAARAAARPRMPGRVVRNEAPYPQTRLTYLGNALNQQAVAFYRRHGVEEVAPAAESGLDMEGRVVMRSRYCLKHQLGLCDGTSQKTDLREPLYLVDEDGHHYRLRFRCADCEMEVLY